MAQGQRIRSGTAGLFAVAVVVFVLGTVVYGFAKSIHITNSSTAISSSSAPELANTQSTGIEQIQDFTVHLTVNSDGSLSVDEKILYDFGGDARHGIYRYIPDEYPYTKPGSKLKYNRIYEISDVHVRSDAPAQTAKKQQNHQLFLRIGDPNQTVTGVHLYDISYKVRGALNGYRDHIELDWNAVGTDWTVPIDKTTTIVSGPGAKALACFQGEQGANTPCSGTSGLTFSSGELGAYEGQTVAISMPTHSVPEAALTPIIREQWSLKRAFSLTAATVAGSLAILIVGLGLILRHLYRAGRDRRFVGLTPGLTPGLGDQEQTEITPLNDHTPIAVAFTPPAGLSPGQVGTLIDERADVADVSASVIDLAVRGYLRIEEIAPDHLLGKRDFKLTKQRGADTADARGVELKDYEKDLLNAIFLSGDEVLMSDLRTKFAGSLAKVRNQLYDDVVTQGWFVHRPDRTRAGAMAFAIFLVVGGILMTIALASGTRAGLLGVPVVICGIVALAGAPHMPSRTAKGSAVLAQSLGFRQYLLTAEADQIKHEELTDVFSRYLPYAMVFGVAERWTKAIGPAVTAQAASAGSGIGPIGFLPWYIGPPGWGFDNFGQSMTSFTSIAGSTFVATPASSGAGFGGGFGGGGFSGGGGGGGGGGSW